MSIGSQTIKADILRHLDDPSPSAVMIAARHGVSARYVNMLVETEDSKHTV